jgi:hypothetical protein
MEDDDQFLNQVLAGISEAEIVTIFFPLLRRALVIDTRHDDETGQMVRVMAQVGSMEERIGVIEGMRPRFGKIRSILGIPWIKSIHTLREQGVVEQLEKRLSDSGMPAFRAESAVAEAVAELTRIEHRAYVSMIMGDGYQTLWSAQG